MIQKTFTYGKYSYKYYLVRQERKTIALTVQPSLNIILKCPHKAKREKIEAFLKRKWMWLEKQIQYFKKYRKKKVKKEYVSGESFLYLGRQYKLLVTSSKQEKVSLSQGRITIHTSKPTRDGSANKKLLNKWYSNRIDTVFKERLEEMCKKMNEKECPKLIIRKMNKRWGSYSNGNKITLNPLLIRASKECIDYVIGHELCHIKHKNHDNNFFKLLKSKFPDWEKTKEKLELRFL
jgi:predicted metal-dependent hydrolase